MMNTAELALALASSGSRVRISGTPKLVFRTGPLAGRAFELAAARTMIGRSGNNDVVIDDSTVSSRHLQVINDDGVWRVVNLISTNGTSVNGRVVAVGYLAPGDVITVGMVEMVFETEDEDTTERASRLRGAGRERPGVGQAWLWGGMCALASIFVGLGTLWAIWP